MSHVRREPGARIVAPTSRLSLESQREPPTTGPVVFICHEGLHGAAR